MTWSQPSVELRNPELDPPDDIEPVRFRAPDAWWSTAARVAAYIAIAVFVTVALTGGVKAWFL